MPGIGMEPRILVADDDSAIAWSLSQILELSGYETEAVMSGEEAIESARKVAPDALISDVVMGGINGIEAAIQIQELAPQCRVILFSGQASTIDLLESARERGYQFEILTKPVMPQILLERLSRLLNEPTQELQAGTDVLAR